jgi:hypothetical protein
MQYTRSASGGDVASSMSGGHGSHRKNGSAGSSPDFPAGGYDSPEYERSSPPDSARGPATYGHQTYSHNAPTMDQSYAGAPVASAGSYHPTYAAPGSGAGGYGASTGHEGAYTAAGGAGYVYYNGKDQAAQDQGRSRSYSLNSTGGEFSTTLTTRSYSTSSQGSNWSNSGYAYSDSSR